MTYSGALMLVACAAAARLLFGSRDRVWAALVMPALLVALGLTFTRSAWVGVVRRHGGAAGAAGLPPLAAVPLVARARRGRWRRQLTDRMYSIFDLKDPTNRDRVAMLKSGAAMVEDHPLTGVGPDHGQGASTSSTACRSRCSRSTCTCTTCRCRSPPSAACRRWRLALVHRGGGRATCAPCPAPDRRQRALAAARARRARRHARRRAVRVQLRRLRVPDAVAGADHAAVCGRPRRTTRLPTHDASARSTRGPRARSRRSGFAGRRVARRRRRDARPLPRSAVCSGISPEAPVPVVVYDHDEYRLGGAANVATNLAALGAHGRRWSAWSGDDERGATAAEQLAARRHRRRRPGDRRRRDRRPKLRIVTQRNQQVARVDYETDADLDDASPTRVAQPSIDAGAPSADVVLVSDYLKGVVTRGTMARRRGARATRAASPVLVDPKIPHLDLLSRRHARDAEPSSRPRPRRTRASAPTTRPATRRARFASAPQCDVGADHARRTAACGCSRQHDAGDRGHLPPPRAKSSDVTGAGDTVIAHARARARREARAGRGRAALAPSPPASSVGRVRRRSPSRGDELRASILRCEQRRPRHDGI